jgi:hypothetical protein
MSRGGEVRAMSAPGLSGLGVAAFYYGDVDPSDYDHQLAVKRLNANKHRRKRGQAVLVVKRHEAPYNPPCNGCSFKQVCQERALACNHFAEWSLSRRPISSGIKRLLPSKKWMRLIETSEKVKDIHDEYWNIISKQEDETR